MVNVINAPDLFTLKDLILYYVSSSHFFFFKKGKKSSSSLCRWWREGVGAEPLEPGDRVCSPPTSCLGDSRQGTPLSFPHLEMDEQWCPYHRGKSNKTIHVKGLVLKRAQNMLNYIVKHSCVSLKKKKIRDFSGAPVAKIPCFQCRGPRFDPWSGNKDPTCHGAWPERRKRKKLH